MKKLDFLSNLAYGIAALFVPWEISVALVMLMVSSAAYHYEYEYVGRMLDRAAMYLVGMTVVILALGLPLWSYGVAFTLAVLLAPLIPSDEAVPAIYGIGIGIQRSWVALVVFLVALAFGRVAERYAKGSFSYQWLHALWHVITAAGIVLMARGI